VGEPLAVAVESPPEKPGDVMYEKAKTSFKIHRMTPRYVSKLIIR